MIRECCVCGQIHCDDNSTDTMYVKTKRKTTIYFSRACYYTQVYKNKRLKELKEVGE